MDGGSTDGTHEIVRDRFPSARCYQSAVPGRSLQMNLGAAKSGADILIFVHVDMRLPGSAVDAVRRKIQDGCVGGGFAKRYHPSGRVLKIYNDFLNRFYLARMHCLVGTNAIFVTRRVFETMNGFPETAFLEDIIFSEGLNRQGGIAVIDDPVIVSSRKYLQNGILKQILRNARVIFGYHFLREHPDKLREIYQGVL